MTIEISNALAQFDAAIAEAKTADAAFAALQTLTQIVVGVKLFTTMAVDMEQDVQRRAYTSDPTNYPTSGTKPINHGPWFNVLNQDRAYFIANTIEDVAKFFFDHALIASLGCGSVVNMPVILGGELVYTVNMLHEEHYYTPERVALITRYLSLPAKTATLVALRAR